MSVPNQTPYIIYNANGLTTVFPFEFYIINAGDIQVSINGTVVTSGYSVSGVGNVGGGDVTFITPPASGSVVMLERVVPTYRLTDYQDNGDLLADTVNKDFDRLWMAIQRSFIYLGLALRRPLLGGPFNAEGYRIAGLANPVDAQDAATKNYVDNVSLVRALRVPESSVGILPPADQRANKLLAFNALGQPITVVPQSGSASDVLIELAKPTGASLIGVQPQGNLAQMRPHITPEMFGAVGDGIADDTVPVRNALIAAAAAGVAVFGKEGSVYGVASIISIPAALTELAYMRLDVIRPTSSGVLSELLSFIGTGSRRITIDIHHNYITCNAKVRQPIILDGTRRCKIRNNTILGVDTPECYGIRLGISNSGVDNFYNDIYENYIDVGADPDGGVGTVTRNGIVVFSNYSDPVVGQAGGPDWAAYPPSVQYTRIFNNTVIGGTHNLHIRGCNIVDIFDNTLVGGSHRNINLSRMCQRIHIHDNMLINAGSSAVVFGYCRWIKITDNYIYSGVVTAKGGDDSAIQFGEWVEELHIQGNTSLGDWVWGVHGETLRGGVIVDNIFEASRAAIAIETQWVATVPSGAAYSVPRNVPFKANTDTFDVKISGNKWKGVSGACGVYLSAFNGRQMQRVDVSDNFISNANMGHAFFLYEDTAGLIGNVRLHEHHAPGAQLANYSFNSNNALSSVSNVSGLTSLTKIITGSGDVAGYGTKSFSISGAFAVTNVLGPYIDGDSITIRGATGATLVQDTTKFRLRGAANAVFVDSNGIIQLVRQSGLWFEQSRNF